MHEVYHTCKVSQNHTVFTKPLLCRFLTHRYSIYRTASLIPSIVSKLDDILLVKELNAKYFDHSVDEYQLLAAVSSPATLIDVDYERLELLGAFVSPMCFLEADIDLLVGDAYLKYLSSIYLFVTFPTLPEGALHVSRQRIVSNRSLLRNANRVDLPQYIQSKPFTPKMWSPPNFIVYRPPKVRHDDEPMEITKQDLEDGELPTDTNTHMHRAAATSGGKDSAVKWGGSGGHPSEMMRENEGSPIDMSEENEAGKSRDGQPDSGTLSKKYSKKKKQKLDINNTQWLGDKVSKAMICTLNFRINHLCKFPGHSRCCGSDNRCRICDRWKRSCVEGDKGAEYSGTPHRPMVRFRSQGTRTSAGGDC